MRLVKNSVVPCFFIAVLAASFPLLSSSVVVSHDVSFHLHRIMGLAEALREGQFPALIQPQLNNGYGYAALAMYPSLFLYIPAVFHLAGMEIGLAYNLFLVLVNAVTFVCMYESVRFMTEKKALAGIMAAVYVLSPYRLGCIYIRGALGEVLALCFLPLVVAGCYLLLFGDKRKWWVLVLGATGMVQSHMISSFLAVLICSIWLIVYWKQLRQEGRFRTLLGSAGLILLCNLGFLTPFLDFYRLPLNVNRVGDGKSIYYLNAIIPAQLFNLFGDNFGISYTPEHGILGEMSMTVGLSVAFCILFIVVYWLYRGKRSSGFVSALFVTGIVLIILSTTLLPWESLQNIKMIDKLAGMIQFPMRLLGFASVCILSATACTLQEWKELPIKVYHCLIAVLVSVSILSAAMIGSKAMHQPIFVEAGQSLPTDGSLGLGKEYLLQGVDEARLEDMTFSADETQVHIEDWKKDGTKVTFFYENQGTEQVMTLPLLWYPGYAAKDEANHALPVFRGENEQAALRLPENSSHRVTLRYEGKLAYKMTLMVSIAAFGVMTVYILSRKRREGKQTDGE